MAQVAPVTILYLAVAVGAATGVIPWFRGWSRRRRGSAIIAGALLVLVVAEGAPGVGLVTYLVAATASSLTLRTRAPMAPVLPTLTLLLFSVAISPQDSASWFAHAMPYGACVVLIGLMRQLALAPALPLYAYAMSSASASAVRRRRRRYVSVPLIGALTLAALLLTAVLPAASSHRRWHARSLAGAFAPREPATRFEFLDDARHLEPTPAAAWNGAGRRLQTAADALRAGPASEGLQRLADHLRTQVDDVTDGTSGGITIKRLDEVLALGRGSPEQKAGVLANAAIAAGYRARIVRGRVSIVPTGPGDAAQVAGAAGGTAPAYAHTWAEVHFVGHGWASFETTDLMVVRAIGRKSAADPSIDWSWAGARNDPLATVRRTIRSPWRVRSLLPFGVLVAPPVLVIVFVLVMTALRFARRAMRRRRAAVEARIAGAWLELADLMRLRGIDLSPARTCGEVANIVRDALGETIGDPVDAFAALADAAWFGSQPPDADDARAAWRLESVVRGLLLRTVPAWRRWILVVDPRPMWPASV